MGGWAIAGQFGVESVSENEFYEKDFLDGQVRYFLKDGLVHVEHELDENCIAYYVIDADGNLRDCKLPYPIEEYEIDIEPSTILRKDTKIGNDGIYTDTLTLKWDREAIIRRDSNGTLIGVSLKGGGGTLDHRNKRFFFSPPKFKK